MNILWLSHIVPYPPKAGVLQRCYNMLHETVKYHEVDLLTFVQNNIFEKMYTNPVIGLTEAESQLSSICRRVKFVKIDSEVEKFGKYYLAIKSLITKYPYSINWLESKEFHDILGLWLQEMDYDLVYFDTISLAPYIYDFSGIPTILDHHNIESNLLLRRAGQEKNLLKKVYYYQEGKRLEEYERKHCKLFNVNITCSTMDSVRLKDIDSEIITEEVPNGVALSHIDRSAEIKTDKSIVFIGTLNWDPNTKAVIYLANKVWPLLKQRCPEAICHIIGSHPPRQLLDLSKNDPSFCVHGFVLDLDEYLQPGTIFVCPIKDGGGTKLKVLDALAMKAAIVADPVACEGINVTDQKNILLASTPEKFVDSILKLFDDNTLRKNLGKNARELIEGEYSYKLIGRSFSNLCEQVVKTDDNFQ